MYHAEKEMIEKDLKTKTKEELITEYTDEIGGNMEYWKTRINEIEERKQEEKN